MACPCSCRPSSFSSPSPSPPISLRIPALSSPSLPLPRPFPHLSFCTTRRHPSSRSLIASAKQQQQQTAKPKRPKQRGDGRGSGNRSGSSAVTVAVKEKRARWKGESRSNVASRKDNRQQRSYVENDDDEEEEDFEAEDDYDIEFSADDELDPESFLLPKPPAGFILDSNGSVSVMAPPNKRVITIVDPATKMPLDCLIRRVFSSLDGRQCFLLCPLDTPVQILKIDGQQKILKEISDEELEEIFPAASYELAKRRLHLVFSGYCLTLRGGFYYSDNDLMDLNTVYGESGDESLHEGVEVANFLMKGREYLVYSPFDPLMFVAYKDDDTGQLIIADDDLLGDEAVLDAIDEEKEFQAYADEEIAMNASVDEDGDSDYDDQ